MVFKILSWAKPHFRGRSTAKGGQSSELSHFSESDRLGPKDCFVVVLQYQDYFLFPKFADTSVPTWPITIPLDHFHSPTVEDDLVIVKSHLWENFALHPDNIIVKLHYDCLTLRPMASATFFLALVTIAGKDYDRISPMFISTDRRVLSLNRDFNIFFDMVARIVVDKHS